MPYYCHAKYNFKVDSIPVLCSDPIPFPDKKSFFLPRMPNDIVLFVNVTQMSTPPSEMTSSKHIVELLKKEKAWHVFPAATNKMPCFRPVSLHKGQDQPP